MIVQISDGRHFDPTHLLENGLREGFPVEGADFDAVVDDHAAATVEQARHTKGRITIDPPRRVWNEPRGSR